MNLKALNKLFVSGREIFFRALKDANLTIAEITDSISIFGYCPDDFVSGRLSWRDVVHPDNHALLDKCGCDCTHEYHILTKSGKKVKVSCVCVADDDNPDYIWVNVKEEKQTVEKARFKTLGDNIPEGCVYLIEVEIATNKLKMAYVSETWEAVTGVSEESIKQNHRSILENMHPDDVSRFVKLHEENLEAVSKFSCEVRMCIENQWRWLQVSSFPHREGDYIYREGIILDITDRKQAEMQLIVEKERLESIGSNIPDGTLYRCIYEKNTGRMYMEYVSTTWKKVTGLSVNTVLSDMSIFMSSVHPDDIKYLDELVEISRTNLTNLNAEVRIYDSDDKIRWLQFASSPYENGDKIVWDGIVQNISRRKESEQKLAYERDRIKLLGDHIPDGALYRLMLDKETNQATMVYASASFEAITGVPHEKVISEHMAIINVMHPEDHANFIQANMNSMDTHCSFFCEVRVFVNNSWRWLQLSSFPHHEEDVLYWEGIILDITDRKEAEIQLIAEKDRLRAIGDNLPDGTLYRLVREIDTGKMYMEYVSASMERVTGVSAEAVMNDMTVFFDLVHPDDVKYLMDETNKTEKDLSYFDVEIRMGDVDNPRWLRIVSQPHNDGKRAMWDGIFRDVTSRRKTEMELEKYQKQLEKMVVERTEEYEAANEELTSSNEELKVVNEELNSTNEELNTANEELNIYRTKLEKMVYEKTSEIVAHQHHLEELSRRQAILIWVLQIVQNAESLSEALRLSLSEMGNFTGVSRVYIFEKSDDGTTFSNTYEWCNDDIEPAIDALQDIPIEMSHAWFDIFDAGGFICTPNVDSLSTEAAKSLREQGIKSIVVLPLSSYGVNFGYVGFDECETHRVWEDAEIELLRSLSQVVSSVIRRMRAEQAVKDISSRQEILIKILQMVQSSDNLSEALASSLEITGKYLGVSRAYVFEKDPTDHTHSNTYEWCQEGINPVIDKLQKIPNDFIQPWYDYFDAHNFVCASDVKTLPPEILEILTKEGAVKSIIAFPLSIGSVHFGGVGFDQCDCNRVWKPAEMELLKSLSQIVSTTLRRQHAEIAIRQSEEMYRQLIAASPDPIVVCDPNGRLNFMSPMALSLFGLTDADVKKFRVLKFIHPHERRGTIKLLEQITTEEVVFHPQVSLLRDDGTSFLGEVSTAYVKDDVGNAHSIVMVIRDITQRKIDEMELIRAKEKAEESDKLKSAFLANLSHEIRTPLNAIVGFISILELGSMSQEGLRECTHLINTNSHQLLKLIDNIIDVSKIEVEQMELNPVMLNLNNLMGELNVLFESYLKSANKPINLVFDDSGFIDPSIIRVDAKRLRQILDVLLDNAIKFTDSGFVRFGYRRIMPDLLEFFVEDSGIGIDHNSLEVIFESFRQVELSNARKFGGAGLGLTISRGLVRLMGGDMWVISTEGQGATFYFTIPYQMG